MNVTVSRFFQRTPPLEKKESRDDDGNDERFITTTKTQFCDEFSSAHARRVSEMMRVGVFLNFRRIDYKSRAKNSKLLSFVSRCVTGVAINLRL